MHAPLQGLVRALAGVDVAVHVLGDVYLQLQRGHGAAPEARLRRVVDTWREENNVRSASFCGERLLTVFRGERSGNVSGFEMWFFGGRGIETGRVSHRVGIALQTCHSGTASKCLFSG